MEPAADKETLLGALREWLKAREGTTFSYFDMEGDDGLAAVARKVIRCQVSYIALLCLLLPLF